MGMFELDIDSPFDPLFGVPITIDEQVVVYRGYDERHPALSNRVTHFGTRATALGYAQRSAHHRLGSFHTTRPITLLDLRYVRVLLRELFRTRTFRGSGKMECMARMTLAYGLCSFRDQLRILDVLMKDAPGTAAMKAFHARFLANEDWGKAPLDVNPFTPDGIRVGETNNDALSLLALKQLFGTWVDGFVAPRTESVFHVEKGGFITAELVLFDPIDAGMREMHGVTVDSHPPITIDTILGRQSYCHTLQLAKNQGDVLHSTTIRMRAGGAVGHVCDTDEFFSRLEACERGAKKAGELMMRFAEDLSRTFRLVDATAPHPTVPLSLWE